MIKFWDHCRGIFTWKWKKDNQKLHHWLETFHFLQNFIISINFLVNISKLQVCVQNFQDFRNIHEGLRIYGLGKSLFQMNYQILLTSEYIIHFILELFSISIILLWNVSREWFWLRRWSSRVLNIESESVWWLNWGAECLNVWTWKWWKLVALKYEL